MSKRELIEPHKGDKRYVRRDEDGRFKESDDVGRSLAADRRRKAKTVAAKGQGDRGDRKRGYRTFSCPDRVVRQGSPPLHWGGVFVS